MRTIVTLSWLIISSLIFPAGTFAEEKKLIRWLGWEQSPNFITQGKFRGQGLGDSLTRTLQLALPQYQHEDLISNTSRYNVLIREHNVCVAMAWIIPGSRAYRIHSRPISLAPATGIQTLKSNQHLFGRPGEVLSLEKLLQNPDIVLGYLEAMAYSKRVHELLDQYRGKANVQFSSRSEVEFSLDMLDGNRLDYFFGFSSQAIFNAAVKGIPNQYQFYQIEEMNEYTSLYTHCAKSPLGIEVMNVLEEILTDELLLTHLAVVERWNGVNNKFRDVFMDYVINQNPNKLVNHPGE